jgi:hypothetical protein
LKNNYLMQLERKREHTCYLFCSNSFEAGFGCAIMFQKREREREAKCSQIIDL